MTAWVRIWGRLELRSRSSNVRETLKARIHDPAWMLARQYQLRELDGQDAGSPVVATYSAKQIPLTGVDLCGSDGDSSIPEAQVGSVPLETLIEREAPTLTYFHALRIGRFFEKQLLLHEQGSLLRDAWRRVLPIGTLDPDVQRTATQRGVILSRTMQGRCVDGRALVGLLAGQSGREVYESELAKLPEIPEADVELRTSGALFDDVSSHFNQAASATLTWWEQLYSTPEQGATAWVDEHLEYKAGITLSDEEETLKLSAEEYQSGRLDWYDFKCAEHTYRDATIALATRGQDWASPATVRNAMNDFSSIAYESGQLKRYDTNRTEHAHRVSDKPTNRRQKWVIPTAVTFSGQPRDRFWDLEDSDVNLGEVPMDQTDVPRLVIDDFALVHGNDWFWTPVAATVGDLLSVSNVLVYDNFGQCSALDAASKQSDTWRLFDVAGEEDSNRALMYVPGTIVGGKESKPIEAVHLVRDAAALMVWAVEETLQGELGGGVSGTDLAQAWRARRMQPYIDELQAAADSWKRARGRVRDHRGQAPLWAVQNELESRRFALEARAALIRVGGDLREVDGELPIDDAAEMPVYKYSASIPENQVPFVPIVPTTLGETSFIQLRRFRLPNPFDADVSARIRALGHVLRPGKRPFLLQEEEVPVEGVRVTRTVQLARAVDGARVLWVGRRKGSVAPKSYSSMKNDQVTEQ